MMAEEPGKYAGKNGKVKTSKAPPNPEASDKNAQKEIFQPSECANEKPKAQNSTTLPQSPGKATPVANDDDRDDKKNLSECNFQTNTTAVMAGTQESHKTKRYADFGSVDNEGSNTVCTDVESSDGEDKYTGLFTQMSGSTSVRTVNDKDRPGETYDPPMMATDSVTSGGAKPKCPKGSTSVRTVNDKDRPGETYDPPKMTTDSVTSGGAKPKCPKDMLKQVAVLPAWTPELVKLKINVKMAKGEFTEKPSTEGLNISALQFLILEKSSLKERIRSKVDKSFKIGSPKTKEMITISLTLAAETRDKGLSMIQETLQEIDKLANILQVVEHQLPRDQVNAIVSKVEHDILSECSKRVHVYNQTDKKLIIVGYKEEVEEVSRKLIPLLETEASAPVVDPINEIATFIHLKSHEIMCFEKLGEKQKLEKMFTMLKIETQTDYIKVTGLTEKDFPCINEIKSWPQRICIHHKILDENYIHLLSLSKTKRYVEECGYLKHITFAYVTMKDCNKLEIFTLSEEDGESAIQLIEECIQMQHFKTEDELEVFSQEEYHEFYDKHKDKDLIEREINGSVILYGTKEVFVKFLELSVSLMKKRLVAIKGETSNNCPTALAKIDKPVNLDNDLEYLLLDETFLNRLETQFPSIIISKKEQKVEMKLHCYPNEEDTIKKGLDQFFRNIPEERVSINRRIYQLVENKSSVVSYINHNLQMRQIYCYWSIHVDTESGNCYIKIRAHDRDIVKRGEKAIMESICHRRISVKVGSEMCEKIKHIKQKFIEKGMVFGDDLNSNELEVVGSSDIFKEFYKELNSAMNIRPYERSLFLRLEKIDYLKNYMKADMEKLESTLHVKIVIVDSKRIVVKGNSDNRENVEHCISQLKEICDYKIATERIVFQQQHFASKLNNPNGKEYLAELQAQHNCLLSSGKLETQQVCTLSLLDKDFHIALIHGRTVDLPVDVVVCPVTECFHPFGYSEDLLKEDNEWKDVFFQYTRESSAANKRKIGDIKSYVPGSSLPCQTIMLTVMFVQHQPINLNDMQIGIMNALEECEKNMVQSVALPVQVYEGADIETQIKVVIKGLENIFLKKKESSIQEIYVCIVDEVDLNLVIDRFSSIDKSFNIWDWRPTLAYDDSFKNGPCVIETKLVVGSLADAQVQLIVNSSKKTLDLSDGAVSSSILQKAGKRIQDECDKKKPITVGDVVETSSGNLRNVTGCIYICHGVLPEWFHRTGLSLKLLRWIMWQCMLVADKRKCSTMAFPAFGIGYLKYPPYEVAKTMFETIDMYGTLVPSTQIKEVRILVYFTDERNKKIFKSVEKERRKLAGFKMKGATQKVFQLIQGIIHTNSGNVKLQILHKTKESELCEEMLVSFNENYQYCERNTGYNFTENQDGALRLGYVPTLEFEEAVKDAFFKAENYRIATVSFLLNKNDHHRNKPPESQVKIIRNVISSGKGSPYLQFVKVYVEDEGQFTKMLKFADNIEDKPGIIDMFKSVTGWKKKASPKWKILDSSNQEEQCIVTITGNQKSVAAVKQEIYRYTTPPQNIEPVRQWYRLHPEKKVKTPLPVEVCQRLDFGLLNKEDTIDMVTEGEFWLYKLKEAKCFRKSRQDVKYLLENEGTSVDDLSKYSNKDEDIFTEITAEINYGILQREAVNDEIKKCGNSLVKCNQTGKMKIVCEKLEDIEKINNALLKKVNTDRSLVLSNQQKTYGVSNADRIRKTSTDEFQTVVAFPLTTLEFEKLKFFCSDCKLLFGKYQYRDGSLMKTMETRESKNSLKDDLKTQMDFLNSLTSFDVYSSTNIHDEMLHKLERECGEIFFYLRDDKKSLQLFGKNYETVSIAKHKAEVMLGIKKQNNARHNRHLVTEPVYNDDKPKGQTRHVSLEGLRSTSSLSTGGSFLGQTYKTTEGIIVKVYNDNILRLNVECIVNAANERLQHGGGIAAVISRAAGYAFEQECDDYIQQHGKLKVGTCCSTSAGNLQYKKIIHTVGPNWHDYRDKKQCCEVLKDSVENCFFEAELCNVSSIAVPSISAGIFAVPMDVCTTQYAKAVEEFSRKNGNTTCLKEIHFIDQDIGRVSAVINTFDQKFTIFSSGSPNSAPSTKSMVQKSSGGSSQYLRSKSEDNDFKHGEEKYEKNFGSATNGQFPKEYRTSSGIKVFIVKDSITNLCVDAIVCPQDEFVNNYGRIAKMIEKVCDKSYKDAVIKMACIQKTEVKRCRATPVGLPFSYVVHAVPPRWDKSAVYDKENFKKGLDKTICNIIRHASDSKDISRIAIPVLGMGDGHDFPYDIFVSLTAKIIDSESKKNNFSLQEIYIVTYDDKVANQLVSLFDREQSLNQLTSFQRTRRRKNTTQKDDSAADSTSGPATSEKLGKTVKHGNLDDCVICMDKPTDARQLQCGHIFCSDCIKQSFKVKPVCPTCGSIQGVVTGDQPPGEIKIRNTHLSLPGYPRDGRIEIEYIIHSGRQGPEHPNEGKPFDGIRRVAYLPDNITGQKISKLFKVAFDRRLIFTIGHSRTTGKQGVVTWNDIHHKTNPNPGGQFGYPDASYFDRVLEELSVKGVTEKDLEII